MVSESSAARPDGRVAHWRTNPWWLITAVAFEALLSVFSGVRLRRLAGEEADLTVACATGTELGTFPPVAADARSPVAMRTRRANDRGR